MAGRHIGDAGCRERSHFVDGLRALGIRRADERDEHGVAERPRRDSEAYQAWTLPQCGQPTEVDTCAANTNPHSHE